ncbi:MAG: hypothetical protein JWR35_1584 [Marmoricola sp.]|jgi:hypothetical protein|nr:hypothetical protein [Marmoricola sp.]
MWFLILLVILAAAGLAYAFRVPLLAKILGQPEDRISRALNKKR